jgi:tetratricopeptide (TPR) repeat protein
MERHELLEPYESTGEEKYFLEAKPLYEEALAIAPQPQLPVEYGYLLECHGRYAIRRAVEQYERAIELDPNSDRTHHQVIILSYTEADEMEGPFPGLAYLEWARYWTQRRLSKIPNTG